MNERVYVEALDCPEYSLVCVGARHLHGDCYCLLQGSDDPEHCEFEFGEGESVRCETREFAPGESGLVAVAPCRCGADWETVFGVEAVQRVLRDSIGSVLVVVSLIGGRLLMELHRFDREQQDMVYLVTAGPTYLRGSFSPGRVALTVTREDYGCRLLDTEKDFEVHCWAVGAGWGPGMRENLHWIAPRSAVRKARAAEAEDS